jgi:structural maintenance of chromosome 3 (chondroitin sulfate proteoglycan 6)
LKMSIKEIKLKGFRCYRNEVCFGDFSKGLNCIVGRNGAGKSNVFAAVNFLLSQQCFEASDSEKRDMLNNKDFHGAEITTAYVEIVFNNEDDRFQTGTHSGEMVLRRQWNQKKDEFFIDGRNVTKVNVLDKLSLAGLTQSNPFFIVQQGKIQDLARMNDEQRLQVLMEVAGATVYEKHRASSMDCLHNAEDNMEKVRKSLEQHQKQLDELQGETEELAEFEELDRKRRALEYSINKKRYDKASEDYKTAIEEEDGSRKAVREGELHQADLSDDKIALEGEDSAADESINAVQQELKSLHDLEKQLIASDIEATQALKDAEFSVASDEQKAKLSQEKKVLLEEEKKVQGELKKLKPSYDAACEAVAAAEAELHFVTQELDHLDNLRGKRTNTKQLIENKKKRVADLKADQTQSQKRLGEVINDIESLKEEIAQIDSSKDNRAARLQDASASLAKLKETEKKLTTELTSVNSFKNELTTRQRQLESRESQCRSALSGVVPPSTISALQHIEQFVKAQGIQGYYGTIAGSFQLVHETLLTAVDRVAGLQLFHVLVENKQVASQLIDELNRSQKGRLTFLPLDAMKPKVVVPSKEIIELGVEPITKLLKFDSKFKKGIEHVFGSVLLCQSKDAALAVQRQTEGEGVTLDGTKYSHKGSLSGGFIDETRSKFRIYKQWYELCEQLDSIKSEFADCEEQHASIIEQKKKILSQLEQARGEVQSLSGDKSTSQVERKQKLLDKSVSQKEKLEKLIQTCEKDIRNEEAAIDAITSADGIRADDRDKRLSDLSARRNLCADKLLAAQDVEVKLQASFTSFQERQETIGQRMSEIDKITSSNAVSPAQMKLIRAAAKAAHDELADLRTRLAALDTDKVRQVQNRRHIREKLEKLLEEERALEAEMSKLNMRARVALDKSAAARKEMDEFRSRNQKLGAPPREASDFQRLSLKELTKAFSDVSAEIKKFDHLNRKAISQYQRLQQEKDDFTTKLKDAEQSHEAVLKLIEKLDQDKDQKISDFFKKVDQHFRKIFPVIVPGGSGELVLLVHSGKQRVRFSSFALPSFLSLTHSIDLVRSRYQGNTSRGQ